MREREGDLPYSLRAGAGTCGEASGEGVMEDGESLKYRVCYAYLSIQGLRSSRQQ